MDNFRKAQARTEIQHNQMMLHEIIEGLNDIVLAQIHHRLCQQPPPEVKEFLKKITLKVTKKTYGLSESIPLPQAKDSSEHLPTDLENGKFLFPDMPDDIKDTADFKKKEKLIQNLLKKYDRMSSKCKIQVEDVRDYLLDHYNMLHKMVENKNKGGPIQMQQSAGGTNAEMANAQPGVGGGQTINVLNKPQQPSLGKEPVNQATQDMNQNNLNPANINSGNSLTNSLVSSFHISNGLNTNPLINDNNDSPLKSLRNTGDDAFSGIAGIKTNFDFGIGKKKGFFSPSELDKYIEDAMKNQNEMQDANENNDQLVKRDITDDGNGNVDDNFAKTNWNVSDKYKRLIETAAKIRLKRKTEEKLGKLYGEKLNRQTTSSDNGDIKDYSQIKFESPVVYSLDH